MRLNGIGIVSSLLIASVLFFTVHYRCIKYLTTTLCNGIINDYFFTFYQMKNPGQVLFYLRKYNFSAVV